MFARLQPIKNAVKNYVMAILRSLHGWFSSLTRTSEVQKVQLQAPVHGGVTMTTKKPPSKVFPIKTFIADLPVNFIPQCPFSLSKNGLQGRRLVIVGDVHGMRKSLEKLLDKVGFDKESGDHLILAGDNQALALRIPAILGRKRLPPAGLPSCAKQLSSDPRWWFSF